MKLKAIAAVLSVAVLGACDGVGSPSGIFLSVNRMHVVPTSDPARFEVLAQPGSAGPDFFCAAADYADRRLNASPADRVVLTRPVARNPDTGRRSGLFTVAPNGSVAPTRSITISTRQAGENMQIAHARSLCNDPTRGTFD